MSENKPKSNLNKLEDMLMDAAGTLHREMKEKGWEPEQLSIFSGCLLNIYETIAKL